MKDIDIRIALLRKLCSRYSRDPNTIILEELGLRHGSTRIDIAVISTAIHGYEIKSDRDTLKRLPDQIRIYNDVLDRITLVIGYRHAYEALQIVPEWWGVTLVHKGSRGGIYFSPARSPQKNPSLDSFSLLRLLWRDEALELLEELGAANGFRSKPRDAIYKRLSEVAGLDLVRSKVCLQLRSRTNWRSGERQKLSDG